MAAVQFFFPFDIMVKPGNLGTPGGKLYFYQTGTTTLAQIWANSGLSVPLENPVECDGAGRIPAVYLDNTKTYRLYALDKNNALLIDRDPYIPGQAPDSSALAPYQAACAASATSASGSATTASGAATTATTKAGVATTQAAIASTQAGIATTEAGVATAAASAASSSLSSVPNATAHAATRSALALLGSASGPAYLAESGREGTFVWDSSNLSTQVTADTQQGIYVAPASAPTGASGAWVRKFTGNKDARWYGAAANGVTDDHVALQAWLDAGGALSAPKSKYYSSSDLIVRTTVIFDGDSYGNGLNSGYGAPGTAFLFAAGKGLKIEPETSVTDPAGVLTAIQSSGYNSVIRNLSLFGAGTGAVVPGVYMRIYAHLENVNVYNFVGKGFDLSATLTVDGVGEYGNLSNSTLVDCGAYNCGSHGLHIRGRDANTCNIKNFTAFENAGWGILNESLIGNTFDKPNLATNALGAMKMVGTTENTIIQPYIETGTGNNVELGRYNSLFGRDLSTINSGAGASTPAQYAALTTLVNKLYFQNTSAPEALSVESAVGYKWDGLYLQGRGSTKDVSLVNRAGNVAAYVPTNETNFRVTSTCYASVFQSQGTNQSMPGLASGYFGLIPNVTYGAMLGGSGATGDATLTNSSGTAAAYVVSGTTDFNVVGNFKVAGTTVINSSHVLQAAAFPALTGDVTTSAGSLAAALAANAVTYAKFQQVAASSLVGNATGSLANATAITLAGGLAFSGSTLTAAGALTPTSVASTGAVSGTTVSGSTSILSSGAGGIGYSTGSGGAVTQPTSRTTGVTLNKPTGAITLFSTTTTAGQVTTFTVTNSQIAATDTNNLSVQSGMTGVYFVFGTAVAAGSFSVSVYTPAAVGSAEAPIINFAVVKAVAA